MLWYWLFKSIMWTTELPFHMLPAGTGKGAFMAIPDVVLTAVETLGSYTRWFLYLLGDTAGDAFVLVFTWTIPLILVAYFWRVFKDVILKALHLVRGAGGK